MSWSSKRRLMARIRRESEPPKRTVTVDDLIRQGELILAYPK
jgi:hypothetical protein